LNRTQAENYSISPDIAASFIAKAIAAGSLEVLKKLVELNSDYIP
jgi:hypothetical protein